MKIQAKMKLAAELAAETEVQKLAAELTAAAKVRDFQNSVGNDVTDIDALCLPCEDAAYDDEFCGEFHTTAQQFGQSELLWVHSTVVGEC